MHIEFLETFNKLSRSERLEQRESFHQTFAWAVPNEEAIQHLVSVSPIVEIGAGTGYWAHLVREAGGIIKPFDAQPYKNNWCNQQWTEVEVGDPTSVSKFPDHSLFLCWPPYASSMAYQCLINYSGERFVYVGDVDGATACSRFRELLKAHWVEERTIEIPRFPGMYDFLFSYRRK